MTIALTPEQESIISQKVKNGGYSSETEVVSKALKLLDDYDRLRENRREELRNEIQKGVDDIKEGRFKVFQTGEEIAEEVIARAKQRGKLI